MPIRMKSPLSLRIVRSAGFHAATVALARVALRLAVLHLLWAALRFRNVPSPPRVSS
jgi:hypothetical protein